MENVLEGGASAVCLLSFYHSVRIVTFSVLIELSDSQAIMVEHLIPNDCIASLVLIKETRT